MTKEQFDKLDKCWYSFDIKDTCIETKVNARTLLGAGRFDLYAILLYIDSKVRGLSDNEYHNFVYQARTDAITNHQYCEIGKPHKINYDSYRDDLDKLIESHLLGTYDEQKTIIPIDKNGILIDGAHRVACAAYFNKDVTILKFIEKEVSRVDYNSLAKRLLPIKASDAMALEATKWHEDFFMLLFWPITNNNKPALEKSLNLVKDRVDVIYEKKQKLTFHAIRNLMLQLYGHMDWIGSIDDKFKELNGKVESVWANGGECRFLLIQAKSLKDVLNLKDDIRNIFQCGQSSIHSTDTMWETRIAANAIFNSNSFHFLTYGQPDKYKNTYELFHKFKHLLIKNGKSLDEYIIDSGMCLGIYGARQSDDLDYLCEEPNILQKEECNQDESLSFEYHGTFLRYYNLLLSDILYNPEHYFEFEEIKFVSLPLLNVFKQNRCCELKETKDKYDTKLIDSLYGKSILCNINLFKERTIWNLNRKIHVYKRSVITIRNTILKKIGLYDFLKALIRNKR